MSEHRLIVALGEARYRVERPFGRWQANSGMVTDVAIMDDQVMVLLRHDPLVQGADARVVVLDSRGGQVAAWSETAIADAHLMTPGPDGTLLVVDRDMHEVVILDRDGKRAGALGKREEPGRPFNHPSDVAVSGWGDIYVSDGYAASFIHRFSSAGRHLSSWGDAFGVGDEPGVMKEPHALATLSDGRVVVVDRIGHRLQVYTAEGRHLASWGGFYRPVGIWIDPEDRIYVTDSTPSLHLLSRDGLRLGRCRPMLNGAHGLFGAANGDIFLAETNPSRITRLARL